MRHDDSKRGDREEGDSIGLGGFLRSLLSGVSFGEKAEREEVIRLSRPSGDALKVHNANGRTQVFGEDREDIEIIAVKHARAESREEAHRLLDEIEVITEEVDGTLAIEVELPGRWTRRGRANLEIRLPRAMQISVEASNGKVYLDGLRGTIRARSSNGSVCATNIVGDLEVFTSNAKVSCDGTCGRLRARSSNGPIELEDHRGSIDASTSNGIIRAHLEELGREGIVLATSNGRIILDLPDEVDAEVDMRVDNGVIRNDRQLTSQTGESHGRVRGRLGRGGALIKLRTSNGIISLR